MNNRQKVFVKEYLIDFNATRAAKAAGYSEKTARSIGQRLLTNVDIAAAVRQAVEMPPDEVRQRLSDIARGDIADLMDITTQGFTFKLTEENDEGEQRVNPKTKLIKRIKQKVTTFLSKKEDGEDREVIETEIELYPALDALRDIGKIHGLFVDRSEVSGPEGGAIPVEVFENALKRAYGNKDGPASD